VEESERRPFRLRYRPELDGIRAFSVLAVMGYHLGLSWLPGGFLGVDAFFVLSGFLITCLLLQEREGSGRVSLRDFYARRGLRLLPALTLVLVAVAIYALWFAKPPADTGTYPEAVSTVLYVANWFRAYTLTFPYYLAHTWSLSIEEQFYVVWPLLLVGLLAIRVRGRALLAATAAGAVASAALMVVLTGWGAHTRNRAYYGTDTRAQALLIGCALAAAVMVGVWPTRARTQRIVRALAWISAAFVVVLWVVMDGIGDRFLYRGGFTIEELAVALIVVHVLVAPAGWMARGLAVGPLRWIGRLSYGLYLWHWPVFLVVAGWGYAFWTGAAVKLGLTFVLAVASFYLVERPILSLRRRFRGDGTVRPPAAQPAGAIRRDPALAATGGELARVAPIDAG
jgi:peptidoglycan/LPS O-acetylase OafA/YrhL